MSKLRIAVILLVVGLLIVGGIVAYALLNNTSNNRQSTTLVERDGIVVTSLTIKGSVRDTGAVEVLGTVKNNSQRERSAVLLVTLTDNESNRSFTESVAVDNIPAGGEKVFGTSTVRGYANSEDVSIKAKIVDILPVE